MIGAKIQRDLLLATSTNVLQKLFSTIVIVVLARHLDKASMGELFFAIAASTMAAILTEFGMSTHINRSAANDPANALPELSAIITLRLVLIAFSLFTITTLVAVLRPEMAPMMALIALAIFLENLYFTVGAFFLGLRHVGYRFATGLTGPLLLLVFITATVASGATLTEIAICYVVANAIMVSISIGVVRTKIGSVRLSWGTDQALRILKASMPFFVLAFLAVVHFKVDTLMLFFMDSAIAVASYEASYKILEVSRFAVRPVSMVFFPICAALALRGELEELRTLSGKLLLAAAAIGFGMAVIIFGGADFLMPTIFGQSYLDSSVLLKILFLVAPALYVAFVASFLAVALHLEKTAVRLTFICVLLNVVLNVVVIPVWGALGAAWSTVITESALAFCLIYTVRRKLGTTQSLADDHPVRKSTHV